MVVALERPVKAGSGSTKGTHWFIWALFIKYPSQALPEPLDTEPLQTEFGRTLLQNIPQTFSYKY